MIPEQRRFPAAVLAAALSARAAPGVLKLGILRGKSLVECDCVPVEAE